MKFCTLFLKIRFCMIKKLIIACLFTASLTTFPRIAYDSKEDRIFTLPYADGIDNNEYVTLIFNIVHYLQISIYHDLEFYRSVITGYLTDLNTPTSLRLLNDIGGNELIPVHLVYFVLGIIFTDPKKESGYINDLKQDCKGRIPAEEFDHYVEDLRQLGTIVLKDWNQGIIGESVDEQIHFYVKNKASDFLKKQLSGKIRKGIDF